jgi:uncharacterized membrane protein (UPF0127 family)
MKRGRFLQGRGARPPDGNQQRIENAEAYSQSSAMRIRRVVGSVVLVLVLAAGCGKGAVPAGDVRLAATATSSSSPTNEPDDQPQPKLPTLKLWLGANREVIAELARTSSQVMAGMMFREKMAENEGMLFIFGDATRRAFWMKNTRLPLSIAYIDPDGVILEIHDLHPRNEIPVVSKSYSVQFCLEMNQGWFERNMVGTGTVIRTEHGAMAETFFKRP